MHPATVLHDIWRRPHLAKTVRVLKLEQSRPQYKNPPLHQIRECQQALVDSANAISDTLWVTAEEQECLLKGNPSVALWLLLALLPNLQDAELIGQEISHNDTVRRFPALIDSMTRHVEGPAPPLSHLRTLKLDPDFRDCSVEALTLWTALPNITCIHVDGLNSECFSAGALPGPANQLIRPFASSLETLHITCHSGTIYCDSTSSFRYMLQQLKRLREFELAHTSSQYDYHMPGIPDYAAAVVDALSQANGSTLEALVPRGRSAFPGGKAITGFTGLQLSLAHTSREDASILTRAEDCRQQACPKLDERSGISREPSLQCRPVSHTPAISCHVSESLRPFDRSRHRGRLLNEDLPNLFGQEREVKYTVPRDGKIVKLVWTYPNDGGPNGNEFEKIRRQISQKHRKSEDKPDIINREILDAIRKALPTPSKKFWNDVPANSYVDCTVR
ncbi:MAG: hypothetical protein Q9162_004388 [Coniocarpon cinnabarinum]